MRFRAHSEIIIFQSHPKFRTEYPEPSIGFIAGLGRLVIDISAIKTRIKEIIFETTNIDPKDIEDTTSFVEDLNLDSLTLLEIAVNIDQEYGLDLPEDEMQKFRNVQVSAELVREHLSRTAV